MCEGESCIFSQEVVNGGGSCNITALILSSVWNIFTPVWVVFEQIFSQVFLFYDFEFKAICELKPKSKNLTEVGWQQDLIKDIFSQGSDQKYFWSKIFLIKDIDDQRHFLTGFCVKLHQQLVQQGSYRATTAGCGRIINKPFLFYSFHVKAWFVALWSVLGGSRSSKPSYRRQ